MAWIGLWALGSLVFGFGYTVGAIFARGSIPDVSAASAHPGDRHIVRYRRSA